MDSEQKRRILDAHMHLPTQGISLSEKKEILLKEMQKNGIDEGIVISDSAITSEIGNLKDCLELFSDTCYVHVVVESVLSSITRSNVNCWIRLYLKKRL